MNKEILLAYTEFPENHIKDFLDVNPAEQASQGMSGHSQLLCGEFLTLTDDLYAVLQGRRCLLQQFTLPLPPDQAALARTEIIPRKANQGCDQFLDPIAPIRRNLKTD